MVELSTLIGRRIREMRTRAKLSQDKLSEKAGISSKYLGEVERGVTNVTVQVLDDVAKALGVSIGTLLENEHCADRETLTRDILGRVEAATDEELRLIHRVMRDILV